MTPSTSGHSAGHPKPRTIGELKRIPDFDSRSASVSVKNEIRRNLLRAIERNEPLFPGVHGYEDTVIPQIVNALLSRHNFILLGLRGQAKSRILRGLISLLDPEMPVVAGCEINDDPLKPICRACREKIAADGDNTPISWMPRDNRFVEKLATPDVTMADIIGDVDPIRAARGGRDLSDELTIHYGLLPRANRGIFAINELPDLAGKIQVGLFNIMQEGDIQIKGYPLRLPLDVLLVFTANPEDYTARGKIITPLKDRIGAEIRTHYPASIEEGMTITAQEAWVGRDSGKKIDVPHYLRHVVEEIAFQTRLSSRAWKAISSTTWRKSPSRPARTSGWTAAPASASVCPSQLWKASSAAPSSAPLAPARKASSPASPTSMPRFPPSPANWSSNTKASSRVPTPSPANSFAPPSAAFSASTFPLSTSTPPSNAPNRPAT